MDKEEKPVEKKEESAGTPPPEVKKEESGASADQDLTAKLAAKDAEITKLAEERDNYKKGLLAAKGKLPADEESEEDKLDVDTKIQKAVQEALYSEKEKKLQAEKDALFQQALKENAEMKVALANKQGMSNAGDGTPSDDSEPKASFFSPAQVKELKERGWDDKKIQKAAENMRNKR